MTLYRHVDGGDDWKGHAELDRHVETKGSYEMRHSYATESMPDGVILVRDMGGDVASFMVPVEPCKHGNYDAHNALEMLNNATQDFVTVACPGAGLEEST